MSLEALPPPSPPTKKRERAARESARERRVANKESEREREETMATTWKQEEISSLRADYDELAHTKGDAVTKYNPTPGKSSAISLPLPFSDGR